MSIGAIVDGVPAKPRWGLVVIAFVMAGCSDGARDAVECSTAHLYGGTAEPPLLGLTTGQRRAIGRVGAENAPSGFLCTGVLVSTQWVLTASHCNFGGDMTFAIGDTLDASTIASSVQVVTHPDVDLVAFRIEDGSVPAAQGATPIPVLGAPDSLETSWLGRQVELAGRGLTQDGEAGFLEFVVEPIVAMDGTSVIVDGSGLSGGCSGDSGGPLLVRGSDGAVETAGVLTGGSDSCLGLDRYIRLDQVRGWLQRNGITSPAERTSTGCGLR